METLVDDEADEGCHLRLLVERRYRQEWAGWEEGRLRLGDDCRCCTTDTTMAGPEWGLEGQWKHRRMSGQHRCLDVIRCKVGESSGEHQHKKICPWPLLLERFHSIKRKIRVAVQEPYCVCQIWKVTRECPDPGDRGCERLGESCGSKWPAIRYCRHGRCYPEGRAAVCRVRVGR